jgi:hypothetical protein
MKVLRLLSPLLLLAFSLVSFAKPLPHTKVLAQEANSIDWRRSVQETIVIQAPVHEVWSYASNSLFAQDWSIYFDHISPLPGVRDGEVGSIRRCFKNAHEEGPRWDEMTIQISTEESRTIVTFNLMGFNHPGLTKDQYVFVRQLYARLSDQSTALTFQTLYPKNAKISAKIAFKLNQLKTKTIFKKNLINIKAAIEGKSRVYFWEE